MPSFLSSAKLSRAPADVLVVHCSDPRFQAGYHEFLNRGLQLGENYGLLVIPGGPQFLTLVEYLPKFSWVGRKWLRFLVETVGMKRLILIAHQDCRWYASLPFHLFRSRDPRERQEEDLRRAQRALEADFPGLAVELYYAAWDASDHVTVEPIVT
jgi:hypothetical protein